MDYDLLQPPRGCWQICPLRTESRKDLLLVRIDPPVLYRNLQQEKLILASRYSTQSVLSINEWPIHVHVAIGPASAEHTGFVADLDLETIAWAAAYFTKEDASKAVKL
jgi:hypothetical protein